MNSEILVVGAGPTGLTVACSLARCGVAVRVVDQALEPLRAARATAFVPRTLETFDDLGVLAEAMRGTWADSSMRIYRDGVPLPRRQGAGGVTLPRPTDEVPYPVPARPLPTWRVEEVLRDQLTSFGVKVEFGRRLVNLAQDDEGVTATIGVVTEENIGWGHAGSASVSPEVGDTEGVRVDYLVGCDGARGVTREVIGLRYRHGQGADHIGFLAELQIDGLEPTVARTYTTSDGRSVHLNPIPHSKNVQFNAQLHPDEDGNLPELTLELAQRILDDLVGPGLRARDMTWKSLWQVREAVADRFRAGRVFIAGDAAHINTPLGGQGANTGIADGYNLGWKLGYVANGWSPPSLLDSYDAERRPVVERMVDIVSEAHRQTFKPGSDRDNPARARMDYGMITQLGIAYPDSALSGGKRLAASPTSGDRAPDGRVVDASTGDRLRLFDLYRGHHFTMLCFGAELTSPAAHVAERYGDLVRTVIVKGVDDTVPGWNGTSVVDPDGLVAASYQAGERPLVLVRPDGHIAFHGRANDGAALVAHLDTLVLPSSRRGPDGRLPR